MIIALSRATVAASYSATVLADSPVHYWRLDETSGNFADQVGGFTWTANGSLTYAATGATTDGNKAVSNAAGGYGGHTGYGSIPVGTVAWSLEAFVKTTSTVKQMIISYGSSSTRAAVFFVINGLTNPRLGVHAWSDDQETTATGLLDGNWHHVVATHAASSATIKIYMDGSLLGTLTYGGNLNIGTGNNPVLMTNMVNTPGDRLNGSLDEMAIYAAELTSGQVSAHYAAR